jgi:hypothetical protein
MEVEMGERYVDVQIEQARPTFWPHRIWDSGEPRMGEAESQKLKEVIDGVVCEIGGARSGKVMNTQIPKKTRSKRIEKGSEPTVVSIDFTPFATDDEETDWEDF